MLCRVGLVAGFGAGANLVLGGSWAIFVLVLFAVIAPLALVSVGIIRSQTMRERCSFIGSTVGHTGQDNYGACNENMSSYMNVTEHMGGNTYSAHEDMHNRLNMTEHMQNMHQEDIMTAPHIESKHAGCRD